MKGNSAEKLVFGVFFAIGMLFACIGAVMLLNAVKVSKEAVTTTAVITEIDTYRDSDNDLHHRTYVSYEVDGRKYEDVSLGEYSSGMYEGKEIEIKYVPSNPGKPYGSSGLWMGPIMFMVMGLIFAFIGGAGLLAMIRRSKKRKMLLTDGRCLQATVESVDWNRRYKVNGRNPYLIYCTYKDEYTNSVYRFKSGNLWQDPSFRFPAGSPIDVYVDPKDFSQYYVDTEKTYSQGTNVIDFT